MSDFLSTNACSPNLMQPPASGQVQMTGMTITNVTTEQFVKESFVVWTIGAVEGAPRTYQLCVLKRNVPTIQIIVALKAQKPAMKILGVRDYVVSTSYCT